MGSHSLQSEHIVLAKTLPLFAGLSPEEFDAIISLARQERFWPPTSIFCEGDPGQHVMILLSGCIKMTQLGSGGEEVILRILAGGEIIGDLLPRSRSHRSTSARVIQPSVILAWQLSVFERLFDGIQPFRHNMVRAYEKQTQELECRFREVSTEHVGSRLANELIRLFERFEHCLDGNGEIHLSRAELAQLTGTTLYTVSRILSNWQKLGAVSIRRERVQLRDVAALRQLSSGTTWRNSKPEQ